MALTVQNPCQFYKIFSEGTRYNEYSKIILKNRGSCARFRAISALMWRSSCEICRKRAKVLENPNNANFGVNYGTNCSKPMSILPNFLRRYKI